ncbi:MAG TPA: cyclase family protein [Thermoanaerobaculia bacterium]|nr:cyclase family protein [Thermoanaerobaculia bacterium]
MPRLIDISPPISEAIGVWPGDVPFRRDASLKLEEGAGYALSSVSTTLHVGAHADAPSHYVLGGAAIDARPLELYYGPCQVIAVDVARAARIEPRHVRVPIEAPRVLFLTGTFPDPNVFSTDFASLSPQLVDDLHGKGVVLVGIDTPSVDLFDDEALLAHHALARRDMANLEGLVLAHVEPGLYTLVALPLRLTGADASPVRAALLA